MLRKHRVALNAGIPTRASRRPALLPAGQRTIALPTVHTTIAALKAGFAAGLLPRAVIKRELQTGELVEVRLECPPSRESFYLAWDERPKGKAFQWWLERLDRPALVEEWLNRAAFPPLRPAVNQLLVRRA